MREKRSGGAIILAPNSGPEAGPIPATRAVTGLARFAPRAAVYDRYTVFAGGTPVVRTRVGAHAVVAADRVLAVGADLAGRWGWLGAYWALAPIEEFLVDLLDRPLLKLPPIGSVRLDDSPGTPQQQLEKRAKSDAEATRRIERLAAAFGDAGVPLSVAVVARALDDDGEPVAAQRVWPRGVSALANGIEAGVFEPVCHGWLHFDPAATSSGKVEPREFLRLDDEEAGRRIDAALGWQRRHLGDPPTFVAPAWGYSEGALRALARRSLPAWHRAAPEPLLVDGNPRETLIGAGHPLGGVHDLDYGALVRLAESGVPPTPVLHGLLLDDRVAVLAVRRAIGLARLARRRDAYRLPFVYGIRWVGAGELVERYRMHDLTEVRGREPVLADGAEAVLRDRGETRLVRG